MVNLKFTQHNQLFASKWLFYSFIFTLLQFTQAQLALAESTYSKLETAAVSATLLSREFRLDGTVEAINKATVSAQTSGTIQKILFDVEDYVEKGSLLIQLRDTSQQAQLKKAQAGEKEAISNLSNAQDEHKRIKDIYAKKLVSKSTMDTATHALAVAKARLESAKASLDEAHEQLSYTQIKAPYSGIVTERHVEAGETVQTGSKLMTGVSLNKLRVNINVPQKLINNIRQHGKAFVYTDASSTAEQTQIAVEKMTIFPIADQTTNTFKVRLDLPEGIEGLFPGMFVKAALVTGEKQVLMVPQKSIAHRSEVTAVYVVSDDGNINFRQVRLGNIRNGNQAILSGFTEGERVALDPIQAGINTMQQRREKSIEQADD